MKNRLFGEIIIGLSLIGLLVFFINPLDLLMPHMLHPFMIPFLIVLFIIFTAFLWRESAGDERDRLHRSIASRFAYFATVSTLIIGIIYQSYTGKIDPFLVIALCVGLIAKIIGLIYGHFKH